MKVQGAHRSVWRICSSTTLGWSVLFSSHLTLAQEAPAEGASGTSSGTAELSADAELEAGSSAPSSAGGVEEASAQDDVLEGPELPADADMESESTEGTGDPAAESYPYAGARAKEERYDPRTYVVRSPYIERFRPERFQWEVGLFGGVFFPSTSHNLKVIALEHVEYSTASFQMGARVAFFPLTMLGVEIEAFGAGGSTKSKNYSAMFYGVRGHAILQLPLYSIVPFVLVGGGTLGAISEEMGHDRDPAIHFGGGVKVPINERVSVRLEGRDTMTQKVNAEDGRQTHHPAVQLGATFTFERTRKLGEIPPDTDFDGLFDHEDECPTVGALTIDGCPGDADRDGIDDSKDECPMQAGEAPSGCPNLDKDGDGVPIPADQCPEEVGPAPTGCPDRDEDGDGFVGDDDECPTKPETRNGFEDEDGCPDEMPEAVKRFTGVIQGINFKQGTAEIEEASLATLDSAIEILQEHPSVRLEVSGHTSSEGTAERNQELSEERANAVRDYFIEKGVDEDRIVARGAGPSEPIADNATREGRRQNRRIEFRILAQP